MARGAEITINTSRPIYVEREYQPLTQQEKARCEARKSIEARKDKRDLAAIDDHYMGLGYLFEDEEDG
ncbi:hypothetical protein [Pseudoalteromonas rubra]|uniref:hypothetical protein n=1 Tax=Pseudoalteromonas rubra TaxID=43658 RepID=UPI002DBE9A8D|nr:hypothetical protein [Pseudoalteromonas rubra]MEC4091906.1 hypothetical protein [Pseudoalteromonas rubra]